jgi:hypothetical protein
MDDAHERIGAYLQELGAPCERRSAREWTVMLPSHKRGGVGARLIAGERTLALRAFFMRGPDREHEAVYRRLLQKNLGTSAWRFALDRDGDVHLVAEAPLATLTGEWLDELLGTLSTIVDETYESAVRTGFEVPEGTEFRPPPPGA